MLSGGELYSSFPDVLTPSNRKKNSVYNQSLLNAFDIAASCRTQDALNLSQQREMLRFPMFEKKKKVLAIVFLNTIILEAHVTTCNVFYFILRIVPFTTK